MKQKFLLPLLFLLSLTWAANAQDYAFRVLGSKGSNTVNGQTIKIGQKIKDADAVVVADGGYLGLAHSNGRTIEVKEAGNYSVDELIKKVPQKTTSLANKYTAFVISELTGASASSGTNRVKTGAVTRALLTPIVVNLPKKSAVAKGSSLAVKWEPNNTMNVELTGEEVYKVTVMSLFRNELMSTKTNGNVAIIDLSDEAFADHSNIMISVQAVGSDFIKSDEHVLQVMNDSDQNALELELAELPADDTAISHMIKGRYFEDKGLYANAINEFEMAMKDADNEEYQNYYTDFLIRNGLKKANN